MGMLGLLGGAAGLALGGPAGGVLGAQIGGGFDTNSAAQAAASSAQDFSSQQYATRYQTSVKDMQAAGLNPMLAYSQGPGTAPQGVSYTPQNPFGNLASAYQSAAKTPSEIDLNTSSAGLAEMQLRQSEKTVDKIEQETRNLKTDQERLKVVIDNLLLEGQNLYKEGFNLSTIGDHLRSDIELMRKRGVNFGYLNDQSATQTAINAAEAKLREFDVKAAGDLGNVGRNFGQLKPVFDVLVNILGLTRKSGGITIHK